MNATQKIYALTDEEFIKLVQDANSLREIMRKLDIVENNSTAQKHIKSRMVVLQISTEHWKAGNFASAKYHKEKFLKAVTESISWTELLEKYGLSIRGRNIKTMRKLVEEYGACTKHFDQKEAAKRRQRLNGSSNAPIKFEDIFCEHSKVAQNTLRNRIFKERILNVAECSICGIEDTWNGKKLKLQIDHINGNPRDNRLSNLRMVCPNCHSQTATFGYSKRHI